MKWIDQISPQKCNLILKLSAILFKQVKQGGNIRSEGRKGYYSIFDLPSNKDNIRIILPL
jgi:hypothetical protein